MCFVRVATRKRPLAFDFHQMACGVFALLAGNKNSIG
jgi:hypothetical protein